MIAAVFTFVFLLQSAPAPAAPPSSLPALANVEIRADVPKEPVKFGQPFELAIHRTWDEHDPAPAWRDASLVPLAVVPKDITKKRENGKITETRRFTARAFAREEVNIPELHLNLKIQSVLPDPAGEVEAPPGPREQPFRWRFWSLVAAAALAAALVALWFYQYYKKRALAPKPAPVAPRIPPPDRALARLAALRQLAVVDETSVQRFYVEASSILREYLEEQLGVRAPEMTTEEFLNSSRTQKLLETAHRALLSEYLYHCDLVKFARQASSTTDRDRTILSAERFVQETRQIAPPPEPSTKATDPESPLATPPRTNPPARSAQTTGAPS